MEVAPYLIKMEHYENLSLENIPGEIWLDIKGWEGMYQVSNKGRIKSLPRRIYGGRGVGQSRVNPEMIRRILKLPSGYISVTFGLNQKQFTNTAHRVVALTFIPNPENKRYVNHKDGIKHHNYVENLEWATPSENAKHAFDTGLSTQILKINEATGRDHHNSKSVLQYYKSGEFIKEYYSARNAAEENGLKEQAIGCCLRGITRSSGGFIWKWKQ
jgi:hypothetical protein